MANKNAAALQNYDLDNFVKYCRDNNHADAIFKGTQDNLLHFWREGKGVYLYDLMGHELTLYREFTYNRDEEETKADIQNLIENYQYGFPRHYLGLLQQICKVNYNKPIIEMFPNQECSDFYEAARFWCGVHSLTVNHIESKTQITIGDKTLKFATGEKLFRALKRLCTAAAANGMEDLTSELENFRVAHSQVLNQKTLTGTLCLSIHPLDYATASDNENNWSSCMSWQDDGCYRLGTVEMMNSPMVICAYLTSRNQKMVIGNNYEWASKKWRAWIIVDKNGILCNKNYPYRNDELSEQCIRWVAQLAHDNLGWNYLTEVKSVDKWKEEKGYYYYYSTDFMYNDFNGSLLLCPCENVSADEDYDINYSGIANCMNCGREIPFQGTQDSGTLCCNECHDVLYCEHCGREIYDGSEDCYHGPNDEVLCADCYSDIVANCSICGEDFYSEDAINVQVPLSKKLYAELCDDAWNIPYIDEWICPDCASYLHLNDPDIYLPDNFYVDSDEHWTISPGCQEHLLDPRKVPLSTIYRLLGYRTDGSGQLVHNWAREQCEKLHINELYEHYRQYVCNELGELDTVD